MTMTPNLKTSCLILINPENPDSKPLAAVHKISGKDWENNMPCGKKYLQVFPLLFYLRKYPPHLPADI